MKSRLLSAACAAALFCAVAGSHALAAEPKLSSAVAKPLVDAQKLLQSGDTQGALAKVKEAQAAGEHTDYDNYVINTFLVQLYAKLNDMPNADTAAEAAADSPAIPDDQKQGVDHNALLLSEQAQHWQKTIGYGQQLTALGGALDEPVTAALAIAYFQAGDMAHAQQYAQQDINMSKAAGQQPSQASLQIVMNAQVKQNNQSGAAQTLEQLAVSTGDPQAWGQLIDVSMSAQGMNNMYFLHLYRLRLLAGFMTQPDDYTQMGNAAYQAGYPTEAVKVLEQGIAAGKITAGKAGDVLRRSRNDAAADARDLPSIAKAAERAKTGEQDIKLAEDYWGYGRYADSEAAARRAIAKGGLKVPAEGPLMLGMALAAQGRNDEAIAAFGQVNGVPAATKTAHLWTLWLQSKKQPAAQPAAAQSPAQ